MKIFRTGSAKVVKNCQFNFNFFVDSVNQKIACAHYLRLLLHVN